MSNTKFWQGVGIAVESARATAIAITGITKADPAVVSHGGSDPSDGDYVLMTTSGMSQINGRVFRVDNSAAGTFELEGVDSTNFGTFSSGTFEVLTIDQSLSSIVDINVSGGDAKLEDVSTIHDDVDIEQPIGSTALSYSLVSKFKVGDTVLDALEDASLLLSQKGVLVTFKDGSIVLFNCYPSFANAPTGSGKASMVQASPITLALTGRPKAYAS